MPSVRLAALLGVGVLAVHQLRYLIAGASTGADHRYLAPLGSLLAGLAVVALAQLISRAARGRTERAPLLRVIWLGAGMALVAVYCVQELAEGVSPVAHGGWVALPLAALVSLAIAVLLRGAGGAELPARRPWRAPRRFTLPVLTRLAPALHVHRVRPRLLLARGPPLPS
jgi:peptidoglycan/LPS O-acetylase OafA/YrhL